MGKVAGILILDYKKVEPFRGPEVGKHSSTQTGTQPSTLTKVVLNK
jgi:hypothetical protein